MGDFCLALCTLAALEAGRLQYVLCSQDSHGYCVFTFPACWSAFVVFSGRLLCPCCLAWYRIYAAGTNGARGYCLVFSSCPVLHVGGLSRSSLKCAAGYAQELIGRLTSLCHFLLSIAIFMTLWMPLTDAGW